MNLIWTNTYVPFERAGEINAIGAFMMGLAHDNQHLDQIAEIVRQAKAARLGYQPYIGVILLVIFLVPVAFMMHNFWTVDDPQMKMGEMVNFLKTIALAASALMFLAVPTSWPFGLGG